MCCPIFRSWAHKPGASRYSPATTTVVQVLLVLKKAQDRYYREFLITWSPYLWVVYHRSLFRYATLIRPTKPVGSLPSCEWRCSWRRCVSTPTLTRDPSPAECCTVRAPPSP